MRTRGEWVAAAGTPEAAVRRAFAKFKLEKEGIITKDVIAFRLRRQTQTAQPRKSFVGVILSNCSKRQRIR